MFTEILAAVIQTKSLDIVCKIPTLYKNHESKSKNTNLSFMKANSWEWKDFDLHKNRNIGDGAVKH